MTGAEDDVIGDERDTAGAVQLLATALLDVAGDGRRARGVPRESAANGSGSEEVVLVAVVSGVVRGWGRGGLRPAGDEQSLSRSRLRMDPPGEVVPVEAGPKRAAPGSHGAGAVGPAVGEAGPELAAEVGPAVMDLRDSSRLSMAAARLPPLLLLRMEDLPWGADATGTAAGSTAQSPGSVRGGG